MKKLITITMALAVLLPSISAKTVTETRPVKAFEKIEASSAVKIKYVQGTPVSLKITGDEKDVAATKIKQSGNKLKIWRDYKPRMFFGGSRMVTVTITTPAINEIDLDGACSFTAKRLGCSGNVDIDVEDASNIDIAELKANDVEIDCSGASNIKIARASTRKIGLEVSGASNVSISGSTGHLDLECSGASKASLGNLSAKTGEVEVSGASHATTNITDMRSRSNTAAFHKNR